MMDVWLSILGTANFIAVMGVIYLLLNIRNENRTRMSYIVETISGTDKNVGTLAKVVHVFEEETKILQKRKEQIQAKERITDSFKTRNPR